MSELIFGESSQRGGGPARNLKPGTYTVSQTANILGNVSRDTLTRWRKTKKFVPSESQQFGTVRVPLYTDADIQRLRLFIASLGHQEAG